jgi:hypothetical protein
MRAMQVGFNRWLNVIWPFVSLALPLLLICGLTIWFGGGQSRQVVVEMMIRVVVVVGMYIGEFRYSFLWSYQFHGNRRLRCCMVNLLHPADG